MPLYSFLHDLHTRCANSKCQHGSLRASWPDSSAIIAKRVIDPCRFCACLFRDTAACTGSSRKRSGDGGGGGVREICDEGEGSVQAGIICCRVFVRHDWKWKETVGWCSRANKQDCTSRKTRGQSASTGTVMQLCAAACTRYLADGGYAEGVSSLEKSQPQAESTSSVVSIE